MNKLMNKVRKNKKGFTLIELIVVIAILGILVLLAAPRFLGYTKDANVSTMQADAKVLSNAALVYNIENEAKWPIVDEEAKSGVEIKGIDGEVAGTVQTWELKEENFKDHVQNLKGKFEDYALVAESTTINGIDYQVGDIVHRTGVENRAEIMQYGVAEIKAEPVEEEPTE